MEKIILEELKWLYNEVANPRSACPDIQYCDFCDIIYRHTNKMKADDPRKIALLEIKSIFDNPKSACPDVCICCIQKECIERARHILCKKEAFTEIETFIIGILYMEPHTIEQLLIYEFVDKSEYWEYSSQNDCEICVGLNKAIQNLSENDYIYDDGLLHLTEKIFQ